MGNQLSSPAKSAVGEEGFDNRGRFKSFPGSAILEKTFCGSIDTTDPAEYQDVGLASRILKRAEVLCVSSPISSANTDENDDGENNSLRSFISQSELLSPTRKSEVSSSVISSSRPINPSSAMFARALVSEVTDNPKTMKPADMALREKKLLKAQEAASRLNNSKVAASSQTSRTESRPVGTPGGVGPPNVLGSLAYACTGDDAAANVCMNDAGETQRHATAAMPPAAPNSTMSGVFPSATAASTQPPLGTNQTHPPSPYQVTIGLSLSRRHSGIGHPDTITRQTAFDFNELQDRQYKYVSSTDQYGWRAGGGEPGGQVSAFTRSNSDLSDLDSPSATKPQQQPFQQQQEKHSSPDTCYLPIIHIDCPNAESVDGVIAALASGEIFIPHMMIIPEALSVSGGGSPPDLIVRFGCERNDDLPPDDWPNWCLEFMHNQLYEYFYNYGARWMKRPFSITLAKSVRWKTVKHMNRYFAHAEHVIETWRERGPQYLDPQLSYIDGGATPEEVARPHGIYLFRTGSAFGQGMTGTPTNYFSPNFDLPYTTKMTRSLLLAVLSKSWDKKRREWTSDPMPRLVEPATLVAAACGCTDPNSGGFLAREVTATSNNGPGNTLVGVVGVSQPAQSPRRTINDFPVSPTPSKHAPHHNPEHQRLQQIHQQQHTITHSEVEFGVNNSTNNESDDDIATRSRGSRGSRGSLSELSQAAQNRKNNNDDGNSTHTSEEKKSDDPGRSVPSSLLSASAMKKGRPLSRTRYNASSSILTDDEGPQSTTVSGYDTSVAASGTTVLRTNTTHNKNRGPVSDELDIDQENEKNVNGKELYSDEDWDRNGSTPRIADILPVSPLGNDNNDFNKFKADASPTRTSKQLNSNTLGGEVFEAKIFGVDRYSNSINDKNISSNFSSVSSSTADESDDDNSSLLRLGNDHGALHGKATREAFKREQKQTNNNNKTWGGNDSMHSQSKDTLRNHLQDTQTRMDRARNSGVIGYSMPSSFKVGNMTINGATVEQTFSGTSLEYSTDGSSAFFANDQGSSHSLVGQNLLQHHDGYSAGGPTLSKTSSSYDSDTLLHAGTKNGVRKNKAGINLAISKTSSSTDDNDSLLRDLAKGDSSNDSDSLLRDEGKRHNIAYPTIKSPSNTQSKAVARKNRKDDSAGYISIQESASYTTATSIVPSDEDLYAIGWAKALDPASGNYYYFTLDRSKTVWDNPLAPHDGNSSAWGDGTASEVTTSSAGMSATPKGAQSPTKRRTNGRFDP